MLSFSSVTHSGPFPLRRGSARCKYATRNPSIGLADVQTPNFVLNTRATRSREEKREKSRGKYRNHCAYLLSSVTYSRNGDPKAFGKCVSERRTRTRVDIAEANTRVRARKHGDLVTETIFGEIIFGLRLLYPRYLRGASSKHVARERFATLRVYTCTSPWPATNAFIASRSPRRDARRKDRGGVARLGKSNAPPRTTPWTRECLEDSHSRKSAL